MIQELLLLNKQKLEAKQSVVNSLGMLLAVAEGYLKAKGLHIKPNFAYYDHFDVTKEPPELIKIKLLNNYHIFIAQKENYINIFNQFDFYPDNFPPEEIKKLLSTWINYAKDIQEENIYTSLFNLFIEDENRKYKLYLEEIKNAENIPNYGGQYITPMGKAQAQGMFYQYKEEERKNNENKWKTQKNPTVDIILGGTPGSSELSKILNPIFKRSEKEVIEKEKKEKDMSEKINHIINLLNSFISTNRKDQKECLRKEIKTQTKELKNLVEKFKEKYESLDGLWSILKINNLEKTLKNIKKVKMKRNKKEDKNMVKDILDIFFENNDDDDEEDEGNC